MPLNNNETLSLMIFITFIMIIFSAVLAVNEHSAVAFAGTYTVILVGVCVAYRAVITAFRLE